MSRPIRPAALLAACLLAAPALARSHKPAPAAAPDEVALVDHVAGETVDAAGRVDHLTGIVLTREGRVERLLGPDDKRPERPDWRADMGGRVLLPGFVDAHVHVMDTGFRAQELDLSGAKSLGEAVGMVRAYAAAHPDLKVIQGGGWNQESWGMGRFPTAADLDAAVPDRPVVMTRIDSHAAWLNSAGLKLAGITAATPSPPGGRIERAGGKPTGIVTDAARVAVMAALPQPRAVDRDAAFRRAQEMFLAQGITAADDMRTTLADWLTFRRAGDAGALRMRLQSYADSVETANLTAGRGPSPWLYGGMLRLEGVKVFADGALGSRGACLLAPYADRPGESGQCFLTDAQLQNVMSRAAMDGFQVAVHAIGDRANRQVLDAVEELSHTYGGDRRWRVEHAQLVDPADLPRFGAHGVVASMQPIHQTSDRLMAEARLGPDRLAGAYAWASMLKAGSPLAFGSDAPNDDFSPFHGLAAAITRQGADGEPAGGWRPEQRIALEAAWWAYTGGAAHAGFEEGEVGGLKPGQWADFIIVDRDPTAASPAELRAIKVEETWVGGRKVWSATGR